MAKKITLREAIKEAMQDGTVKKQAAAARKRPKAKYTTKELPPAKRAAIVDAELPFMYETKAAEYVFGAELGDGFITLTVPKDRFGGVQPASIKVKAEG